MKFAHGGDIYRNEVIYDFSANINPLGMPKECIVAAKEGVEKSIRYPDYLGEKLCMEIGKQESVKIEQMIIGNGAAELIYAITGALRPKKALLMAPTFLEYEESLRYVGCNITYYDLLEKNQFHMGPDVVEHITENIELVFLCNPNNPTGQLTQRELILSIAKRCKSIGALLVVDECFLDFIWEKEQLSMLPYLEEYPNVIVLKAFTKIYGMPGLRLGYAMTNNSSFLTKMKAGMQPWNTSIPAQMAGIAAMKAKNYLKQTHWMIQEERRFLLKELKSGLVKQVYGSSANYIFFRAEEGLYDKLLKEKILIRDCSNYRNLDKGYYRIAIRTHKENRSLIKAWKKIEQR